MIRREQDVPHTGGGQKIVEVNPDCTFTQVTITGRNSGIVSCVARPVLSNNDPDDYADSDFETITDAEIDLSDSPSRRTFTIENKKVSALKFIDAGAGSLIFLVRQWGRD